MRTCVIDLAKTDVGPPVMKVVRLSEEALCGTKLTLDEVLIYKTDGTTIWYIVNKKGVLHRGSL